MASLTISISGSSVVNGQKSYTLSDNHVQLVIDTMIDKYSPRGVDGNITTPLTAQQALLAWVDNMFIFPTKNEVRNYNLQKRVAELIPIEPIFN